MSGTTLTATSGGLATVDWQTALKTFLDTLSSPRTRRAYERAVSGAMRDLAVDFVADLSPPMLAE